MTTADSLGSQPRPIDQLISTADWTNSPLGPRDGWSSLLTSTVRLILPAKAEAVLFWGPDYVALYNDSYAPTIGNKHPHALGRPAREYWAELWDDLEPLLRSVRETGETVSARDRPFQIDRFGFLEEVYFDISYSPVCEADGSVAGILCIVAETTGRIRETRALEVLNRTAATLAGERDTERLVQSVVDAGVTLTGAAFGAFLYNFVDRSSEAYTRYALAGVERSAVANLPFPRNTEIFAATFGGKGVVRSDDITVDPRHGDNAPHGGMPFGHLPIRSYLAVPVTSRSRKVIGGLFFAHPDTGIFDQRSEGLALTVAAQAAVAIDNARLLEASQRMNESLEEQVAERTAERDRVWQVSRDMLGVADEDGIWLSINPAWTRVLGWTSTDIVGRTTDWLLHPDDVSKTTDEIARLAQGESTLAFESRFRTSDGNYRTLSWTAASMEGLLYTVGRDVTDDRDRERTLAETEEQLRQAQKMEVVGQLTGGIAHDFNNLLQIVTGNLETVLRMAPDDAARLRRAAENAMSGASRAATLTQRLLAFSRRQPLAPKPIDVNRFVGELTELLHRTLGETIRVEPLLASALWPVEADPNQLESAVINLAINARDAMPHGGRLQIETRNISFGDDAATPGDFTLIAISDTGTGMDAATLERVFEPFFTTKDVGKGTGLGLSMVYGFVRQSGGHVHIESAEGRGTAVRIFLPRLIHSMETENEALSPVPAGPPPSAKPGETILVCEDDDDVRKHTIEVLRELGYTVCEAADGPATLRLLERQGDAVDLLFTDVVLPGGMTGAMVAQQARAMRPALRILFTTGYARDAIVHRGRLDSGVALITKPFTFADLATRVRAMLDQAAG